MFPRKTDATRTDVAIAATSAALAMDI